MLNKQKGQSPLFRSYFFKIVFSMFCYCLMCFTMGQIGHAAEKGRLARSDFPKIPLKERQVMEINRSLRNVIEENQRLSNQNQTLEREINRLKSHQRNKESVYSELKKDRDHLTRNMERIKSRNRGYSQEIRKLENSIKDLEMVKTDYDRKDRQIESFNYGSNKMEYADNMELASTQNKRDIERREAKTLDLLATIDAFTEEDERIRMDSARAHYNMGNIYYQKGEYEIASREYYQAVTLMPNDPDAHYNLAFVSGEHLRDYRTALKHYRMYLYLNPNAQDTPVVQEKIIQIKLILKSIIDSPIDRDMN